MAKLTDIQRAAFDAYPSAAELIDPDRVSRTQLDRCGDGLFSFVMSELSDVTDYDEALRRITTARLELQEIERALFTAGAPTQP